ncbi:L-glutamate gamma-semialdehyde dehydrogenase [Natranaerobius thermophilus]|uniref:L-glutamate gamma-semialdehyde dehydrogenase n=1 Tax=Natranaerobius thermophilus (strain ATCC BAA-1301 / DSM 18059 / JW/NM-WN-LF) TaxID=457570 RepID=B2A5G9_NATTJ|nr:L-glutamate gamma-semialdehyde dehydrogenase [Natranaerobius thermophilus]ACB85324.1 delta-1-pyrroline-5-carboxylate dehydrogenase [Natranaerobius thermophilus JW/NM-WN-LF]
MPKNNAFEFVRPRNEYPLNYTPGSPEKEEVKEKLTELKGEVTEIPLIIGGREVKTGDLGEVRMPTDHSTVLAKYHKAGEKEIDMAIEAALKAKHEWERMPWDKRAKIFKKAAALIAGPYRSTVNAATMLGQGKNIYQSEIEAVCELVDFLEFNTYYLNEIYKDQPDSLRTVINQVEYRPLEGFIFAVSPFNFTAIGGNLPSAPAIAGNVSVWKPASTAVYSNYIVMKIFEEAGLPPGVINFIPGSGGLVGNRVMKHPDLAGVHFTGSSEVFKDMWKEVGQNIDRYKTYPRIVGETGGKDFVVAHPTADKNEVITALIRGAYEYQGQKCSAASRAYIPETLWERMKDKLIEKVSELKVGPVEDFTNFVNAVIDKQAFDKIASYIDYAKDSDEAEILAGGKYDDSEGYYIWPTVIKTDNPKFKTMEEEIFGPVLTVYVYPDNEYEKTLELCNETSPYGLTGSIIAKDKEALLKAEDILTHAAGNFYINDKPTGSVVGQQPFGGARASGTNDKAGSMWNIIRWISPRSIKENLNPPKDYRYPCMEEE